MTPVQEELYLKHWDNQVDSLRQSYHDGEFDINSAQHINKAGLRDMSAYRLACLLSYDLRLFNIVKKLPGEASIFQNMTQEYNDGGASAYFAANTEHMPIPDERKFLAKFMCMLSPKTAYIASELGYLHYVDPPSREDSNYPDRVLIFCRWPLVQWQLECWAKTVGLNVLSLTALMKQPQREEVARQFNDPYLEVHMLIVGYQTAALGINLQGACHRIYLLDVSVLNNDCCQAPP